MVTISWECIKRIWLDRLDFERARESTAEFGLGRTGWADQQQVVTTEGG